MKSKTWKDNSTRPPNPATSSKSPTIERKSRGTSNKSHHSHSQFSKTLLGIASKSTGWRLKSKDSERRLPLSRIMIGNYSNFENSLNSTPNKSMFSRGSCKVTLPKNSILNGKSTAWRDKMKDLKVRIKSLGRNSTTWRIKSTASTKKLLN